MKANLEKNGKAANNNSNKQTQDVGADKESVKEDDASQEVEEVTELSEDMEMVSPGAMLREARKLLSLSQEHIASKLNFKVSLVKDIEEDTYDPAIPATFNRGYLANYAKLVEIDVVDVLASYDALDAATIQRSEMLSFSKGTTKQAEQSRVMWISYLIVAIFIGLTVVWWLQENSQQESSGTVVPPAASVVKKIESTPVADSNSEQAKANAKETIESDIRAKQSNENEPVSISPIAKGTSSNELVDSPETLLSESLQAPPPVLSTAVFTFKGDCWVNIFDAKGERIAWGVKKAGYVMPIQGEAPLKITVGKPELTSITFNDEPVDMSAFNTGNIAKFSLPLGEYAN